LISDDYETRIREEASSSTDALEPFVILFTFQLDKLNEDEDKFLIRK